MVHLPDVNAFIHAEMPLTRAMGLEIVSWDGTTVCVQAPLELNQNHADTAFGGSISTMGIIAGYALLHLIFLERQMSMRILIQNSSTEFLRPIDADFSATASAPPAALEEFLATIARRRRARLELESQVLCRKLLAARHKGLYVAMVY